MTPSEINFLVEKNFAFLKSAGRFLRHGAPTTPPDILATREATCRTCPEWDSSALNGTGRCRKCGCATWAKLRMATERCPLGKWEALTTDNTESRVPEN